VRLLEPRRCRRRLVLLWNRLLVQSFDPLKYCRYWFGNPALPLALASAVRFFLNGVCRPRLSRRTTPLFELHLPLESYPVAPTRSAAADRVLSWALVPYSTSGTAGPLAAGLPARYVPPSGFGYPLGVLRPAIPCRFYFAPAALVRFTLRRFLLPEGIRSVTTRKHPHTVQPIVAPAAEALGRPNRPRFLGFDPSRSPWRPLGGLARQPLEPPMGFALLGYSGEDLGRSLPPPPLTRFAGRQKIADSPAPQSIDRPSLSPLRPPVQSTSAGKGNPYRVSAPA
jgi:hypothetical protein